ncbi:MAG TPA: DUF3617 family protein [Thermoanaerobaculia bacterium]|jgi:phage gp45-like|nr:DUF3617 family protein [Thermoanaerobaculia bacterium]
MKKTLILAAATLALPIVASAGPMKAGKWEVTLETPAGNRTVTRCVTQDEADHPKAPQKKNDECKIDNYKVDGNTVTFNVSCKSGATMDGKTTYTGDTYAGEMHMKMGDREFTQHSTGKYLGKCD